jgi:ABC-2 type transport system ATP-binding protein
MLDIHRFDDVHRDQSGDVPGLLFRDARRRDTSATGGEWRMARTVVDVENLHKSYGSTVAVDDVSFAVEKGEIFGILGPNGAGKTTTVECVTGLRARDAGRVRVLGLDPLHDGGELRRTVGVQLQESALPSKITVAEALELYASFYRDPASWERLLSVLGLTDKRDSRFGTLSGGQKQRVSIALALVGNPSVVVLDG